MKEYMILSMILPILIYLFGHWLAFFQTKRSMFGFGYRTYMTLKSDECWNEGNQKAASYFQRIGIIEMIVVVVIYSIYKGATVILLQSIHITLLILEILSIMATMILIELKLWKKYDQKGNKR